MRKKKERERHLQFNVKVEQFTTKYLTKRTESEGENSGETRKKVIERGKKIQKGRREREKKSLLLFFWLVVVVGPL